MVQSASFHRLLNVSNTISAGFSSIFNFALIYLILTKSPKEFGSYKYLLVFTSVFEVFYSVLEAYLVPIHFSYGTTDMVLITATDKSLPRFLILVLNSVYWGGFGATQSIYAVHFIYRYFTVAKSKLLSTFNSWGLVLWLLVPISMGAVWSLTGLFLCGPNQNVTELVRESVLSSFGEPIENFEYLGGTMYDIMNDGSLVPHWKFLIAKGLMSSLVIFSFVIIIYCAVKCYSLIHKMVGNSSSASAKSKSLQSQLFNALVCQIIIPLVFLNLPIVIFFILNLTNNGIKGNSGYLSLLITFYPVIDPLPNFFIIKPYRNAIIKCFVKPGTHVQVSVAPTDVTLFQLP